MDSVTIQPNKKNAALVDVKMTVSKGKLLAIMNSLEARPESAVSQDVLELLKRAVQEGKVDM